MNCEEALVEMETISTTEIAGSAVAFHSAHCPDCARVLQAITDADRLMMQERDEAYFTTPPEDIARRAVLLGQRRGIFAAVSGVSLVLMAGSVWYAAAMLERRPDGPQVLPAALHTESFEVRCLSDRNVEQLLQAYLHDRRSQALWTDPPLRVLTVTATEDRIARVRDVLRRFDTPANGVCSASGATAPEAAPEAAPAAPEKRSR